MSELKKALVSGANGFIGKTLIRLLLENGVSVIALDRKGCDNNIPDGVRFVGLDLAEIESLPDMLPDRDIDVFFHLAWAGASGNARADYALQTDNIRYTCDAVKTAAAMSVKRFVGAGTLMQLDGLAYNGLNDSVPNPVSCYGTAKTAAQYMSKALANSYGIEHVWCYIPNTYGVGNTTQNFVNMATGKMLSGERAAFTAAEQNYDFVYITDTINGIYLCGKNGKPNRAYYIGSGSPRRLKEYITIIRDAIDPAIQVYLGEIPFRGVSLPMEAYSIDVIKEDTGYSAQVSFEQGIKMTVEWLKSLNKD